MGRGVNKAIIVGNLGADPETRYTSSGSAVVNMSIATSEKWTDKQSGQPQERAEWHKVVMFNKLAEIAAEYLRKGSQIYLEGKLQTRKWQDQSGQDRYTTEIVANEFQILGAKTKPDGDSGSTRSHEPPRAADHGSGSRQQPSDQFADEQIPF